MEKVLLIGERGGIGSAIKMLLKNDYELFMNQVNNFEKMFVDLALKYELILVKGSIVDMISSNQMQSDGIHPNQAGHVVIKNEVWRKIKPILKTITD